MMDFYEPFWRRPDNHMSWQMLNNKQGKEEHRRDCLHWSSGAASPLRYWPVFLQNRLLFDIALPIYNLMY